MRFDFTEEQLMMQKMVREFAEKEVAPGAAERDEKEEFSRELYDAMGEMGLTGICFPEQYGGADGDYLSYIMAVEEISRADDSVGVTLATSVSLCQGPIFAYGTEEQKEKYLTPLVEGSKLGAFGLTEPNAGTDAASQQTVAVDKGDHYLINGSKIFITNGGEAETYVIFAMTDKTKGVKGITAFIIEKGMPGFTFGKKEHKLGIRGSITMELIFQDLKVPKENRLGKEGEGFKIAMSTLDGGRIGIAAQALGIAQAALDASVKYSKERIQFGKPIASNQAVAFMLADMATKIDAARFLVYRAAYLKDQGKSFSKEAAMAKMYASDIAMAVTTDAVQIFGGYGYIREYPVERLMRNAKITQIYEGTNQVQRIVISSSLLR
ncbi:acyl-CoA dehydrogenase [Sporomusa sphaeroides]|jgi:butyryl-CoA dehydrogenase|uniref:acyl-CoA dehydrogenase n=1 Tax=Sporomusa sphaeroides TaxID=47679 RepID=UPI002C65AB6B|nr:acyl-CoA dehydrogenase [Sporomusa sphaeroides]HML33092.1 acyl-CoA dehydrogenase [Sporomusa sphaeroides]